MYNLKPFSLLYLFVTDLNHLHTVKAGSPPKSIFPPGQEPSGDAAVSRTGDTIQHKEEIPLYTKRYQ